MYIKRLISLNISLAMLATAGTAQVTPPPGYIYTSQLLGNDTQGCIADGPGGTFVGTGPAFTANAQSVVLTRESGDQRLVVSGFNAIGDCAYDAATDTLYVTDNASEATGALTGDTVFAVPSASSASGLGAPGLELLTCGAIPSASSVAVESSGDVFVSDAAGGGSGTVVEIVGGSAATFASGFDFTGALAFDPATADLFVAQNLATFENQIDRFDASGAAVPPTPFAAPSFGFGSYDAAFDKDGQLIVTGLFGGDVVSFDPTTGLSTPFISGLTFASGITVDPLTGRVSILSSTFTGADEDKSLHRFTPIDELVEGVGNPKLECGHEFYGLDSSGKVATCTDGSACDADGTVNDRCRFPVGFCLNVDDPDLPTCTAAASVTEFSVKTVPYSTAIADAAADVVAALPINDSTCFFTDGIDVPVKVSSKGNKKDGKGKIVVKTKSNIKRNDKDTIKLVCQPAP